MKTVISKIKLNFNALNKLDKAVEQSLVKTAEALKTEVVIAQVMPFGDSYERDGKKHQGGTLQNTNTNVNDEEISKGKVNIISNTPYARRMYYHPEYNFRKIDNKNAKGLWYEDWISGKNKNFAQKKFAEYYKESAGL